STATVTRSSKSTATATRSKTYIWRSTSLYIGMEDRRLKNKMSSSQEGAAFLADGFSQNRPPRFEGMHYNYWKNRMELFVKTINPRLWRIVTKGPMEVK
ncbi:hypothetical protein LINPERHAP1_LOCUS21384, partial [Linum perenne]